MNLTPRLFPFWIVLASCGCWVAAARAQTSLAAGAPLTGREPPDLRCGHGWMIAAGPAGNGRAGALIHVPPRDGTDFSRAGTFRIVLPLELVPRALAAWEDRVWLVFAPSPVRRTGAGDAKERLVASVWAERTVTGTWDYLPQIGAEAAASLPGDGDLVGFVGTPAGPLALLHDEAKPLADRWQVLLLAKGQWKSLETPAFLRAITDRRNARVVTTTDGPAIIRRTATGEVDVWPARVKVNASIELDWAARPALSARPADGASGVPWNDDVTACWSDGQVVLSERVENGVTLRVVRPGGVWPLISYSGGAGAHPLILPLDGLGRLAVAWPEPEAVPAQPSARGRPAVGALRFRWAEVSVFSGRQLSSADAKREGLLSPRDFQLLTLVFAALMMAVLLFVLRTDRRTETLIPAGTSLATPGRRLIAAALDAGVAFLVACGATGATPAKVLAPASLTNPGLLFTVMGLTVFMGVAHAAAGEWLSGRSLGKALTGCRVIRLGAGEASPEEARPFLWQALARNGVRWLFPPLGMLMVFDRTFRHPGDVLARTIVIVEEPPEDEPGGEGPVDE